MRKKILRAMYSVFTLAALVFVLEAGHKFPAGH